jgi:threonyl-tRNA synthetase
MEETLMTQDRRAADAAAADAAGAGTADQGDDFEAPVRGSAEELLDAGAHSELDAMRHSTAHVMAEAVLELVPGAKLGIGPAIQDGFYYDFELSRPLTPDDLSAIEARMAASVAADHRFVRAELPPDAGRAFFVERGQPYKVEILDDLATRAAAAGEPAPIVTTYEHGPFIDLCKGPHVASTGRIGPFKLLSVAGAYWRGDEHRPMLQRIYGTVWDNQADLDQYLWRREEARKRDHRKLGRELDLFSFHSESPAAPFWHPRGMALWRALEAWSREVRLAGGFDEVRTPAVVRKELWETSGHWAHYQDNMFVLEDGDYTSGLKPMNCPESMLIYKTRVRSYRDLPMRLADYSWLFRNERTGALAGMFRVRQLTQDDSHVVCREDQIIEEVNLALSLVRRQYAPFGFEPTFKLATRPDDRLGNDEFWEMAESKLAGALDAAGIAYTLDPGGGAFYAPKIDVFIEDALGRQWQMATIQLDYQLPERFDLEYRSADGGVARPVVIHYAIYGSFERFIGILVEHYAGAFPLWLAPVQAVVIPIADRHIEAGGELATTLRARGLRVEVDGSDNRMQNKIRLAQEQKIPYMLVLGDREIEGRTAAPRTRAGEQQPAEDWDALAERLAAESAARGL